jgi:hypothetical protein
MEPKLMPDGRLRIGDTLLDAVQTTELIEALADIRAQMQPPVSRRFAVKASVAVQFEPATTTGMTVEGRFLLALRHEGFGWCSFDFGLPAAARLRDAIARHTGSIAPAQIDVLPADLAKPSH